MSTFRVTQAEESRRWKPEDGSELVIDHLTLEANGKETLATMFRQPTTPMPEVGSTIEGELGGQDNFDKGRRKFKKDRPQGGGGRGEYRQQMHPAERRAVEFQSARRDALHYIELKVRLGKIEDFDLSDVGKITDGLRRLDDPPAPASDIPGDDGGLPSLNEPL